MAQWLDGRKRIVRMGTRIVSVHSTFPPFGMIPSAIYRHILAFIPRHCPICGFVENNNGLGWFHHCVSGYNGCYLWSWYGMVRYSSLPLAQRVHMIRMFSCFLDIRFKERGLVPSTTATPPTTSLLRKRHNSSLHIQ